MLPATALASRLFVRARLRHLQVLARAAELRSIQRTADAVGLTQPSTSHVLADLERLVECQLFVRHARGVTPTAVTLELMPLVRRILDTVGECADVVTAVTSESSGVVQVAAITGALNGLLAPMLPEFGRRHPSVLVNLREGDIEQIGAWLARGGLDLVFCRTPAVLPEGWRFQPLLADRFVVVSGPQHPLVRRRLVTLDSLWDETWLQGPVHSAPRRALDALAAERGRAPRYRLVSTRSQAVMAAMLRHDRLLSLAPSSIVRPLVESGQIVMLKVDVPATIEPIGALRADPLRNEASRAFLADTQAFAARLAR